LWERTLCATTSRSVTGTAPQSRTGCAPTGGNRLNNYERDCEMLLKQPVADVVLEMVTV